MTELTVSDRRRSSWLWLVKAVCVVSAIAISATVLWSRQTDDALLGANSIAGAVAEVAIFALPGVALYLWLARRPFAVICEGVLIVTLLAAQWWESATKRSSTASLGPVLVGWLLIPSIVFVGYLPTLQRNLSTTNPHYPKLYVMVPVTAIGLVLGPPGWIAAGFVWWIIIRRSQRADELDVRNPDT